MVFAFRVRVLRTVRHTPTQNVGDYPPGPQYQSLPKLLYMKEKYILPVLPKPLLTLKQANLVCSCCGFTDILE